MVTQRIIERYKQRQEDRGANLGPRESVYGYRYDAETDDGSIWMATMPLSVINEHGALDCRNTYDLQVARRNGAAAFGLLGAIALAVFTYQFAGLGLGANGAIMGLFVGGMAGGMVGWMVGHRFAPKPISLYRQEWIVCAAEQAGVALDDTGSEYFLEYNIASRQPINANGEPVRWLPDSANYPGYWRLISYPLRYTNLRGEAFVDEPVPVSTDVSLVGTEHKDTPEEDNSPEMMRATFQWEVMQQRIDKLRWRKHLTSTWERVQLGGAVLITLAIVVLAFFLIVIGQDPKAPVG